METPAREGTVSLNLRDVQAVGLEILLKFDEYCRRHGLRFYLCGGTLLGAVRHGGFIPWDDDVDVFMPRPDFDRLFELDKTDPIGGGCELASVLNGKLPRAFAKLYDTRTRVDRPYLKPIGGPHLWIDILPVDGLPGNERACRRLLRLRTFLEMHNLAAMWKVGTGHRKKMILQYAARYPLAMLVGKVALGALDGPSGPPPALRDVAHGGHAGQRALTAPARPCRRRALKSPWRSNSRGGAFPTMSLLSGIPYRHLRRLHDAAAGKLPRRAHRRRLDGPRRLRGAVPPASGAARRTRGLSAGKRGRPWNGSI